MDFVAFEEAQVHPWIAEVETFVTHIISLVENEMRSRNEDAC